MKQPALGLVATALIIAISLGFISLFNLEDFSGWVSYMLICLIPMEIVVGVSWAANPAFAANMTQPMKGIVLMLVCVAAAVVIGPIYWQVTGAGMSPPPPMMMMCTITSVIIMFWFAIMFGGWPFNVISKNPIVSGILMWIAAYVVNYILFRIFFDYSFMAGAPVYVASLDPGGLFNANRAIVFYLSAVSILFLLLHFDLWPFTTSPGLMKQPTLGIVWTLLALILGGAMFYVGVIVMAMNPLTFMVSVPIPFIFGTIVVLNMLHNSLFASLQQPVKGIANSVAAAVIGLALAKMYTAVGPSVTAGLQVAPSPGDDFERWLASALLGVTFPFLIFYAEFFKMWPLMGSRQEVTLLFHRQVWQNLQRSSSMKLSLTKLLVAGIACASAALAHHSFAAEYDGDKFVTKKGVVVRVDWQNPHMFFYMDVTSPTGEVEQWKFEGFPPNMLVRQGWKKDETMKTGDRITVSGWLARSGEKLAHSREITWEADGRKLLSGPPAGTGGN